MVTVGVRELKSKASEILYAVREEQEQYTITYRGKPVAVLLPIEQLPMQPPSQDDVWAELDRLGEQIFDNWDADQTASQLLTEMRQ